MVHYPFASFQFRPMPTSTVSGTVRATACSIRSRTSRATSGAWLSGTSLGKKGFVSIKRVDWQLHRERVNRQRQQITYSAPLESLPDGVMIRDTNRLYLVWGEQLLRWQPKGYAAPTARPSKSVTVLTPHSTVAALRAGYRPGVNIEEE